jgi:protein-arginine kinase activator protein McsA
MGMTIEQAKKIDNFLCAECAKENGTKRPSNSYPSSPSSDSKVSKGFFFHFLTVLFIHFCL